MISRNVVQKVRIFFMVAIVAVCFPLAAWAAVVNQAKVVSMQGQVQYRKAGSILWEKLPQNILLSEGDSLRTGADSEAILELAGEKKTGKMTVREKSTFTFQTFQHDEGTTTDRTLLDVQMGNVLIQAEKLQGDSKFEVKTPISIVGIRGTTFEVSVGESK